jgi:hypothetical protein
MSTERANPFADTEALPQFTPKPRVEKTLSTEHIEHVAEVHGFPSRQPVKSPTERRLRRRFKTGRNQQINIKATSEVIERLYQMADARRVPLGELLEQALNALQKTAGS